MKPQQNPFDRDINKWPRKVMGIDPHVVQLMLEDSRDEWRKMEAKVAELDAQLARYEDERASVNSALIMAQKSADDLLRQAQDHAEAMIEEAKAKSVGLADEHRAALRDLQHDLETMTLTKQKFGDDFRALLRGYLAELDARFPATTIRPTEFEGPVFEPEIELPETETEGAEASSEMNEKVAD